MLGPWTDFQRRPTDITSGNYHGEMNSEKFIGLLRGKLIPNLPPKSVVVIDNASYHSVQGDKCPTQASRKADMQAWLTKHNVAWSNDKLLELCKTHRPLPTYVADETLKQYEHRDCDPVAPLLCGTPFQRANLGYATGKSSPVKPDV